MKAFVTGGTGFIGSRVARRLRERGDEVVALVRSPAKAAELRELGCELVEGDLSSEDAIRRGVEGCDAVFHVAAVYKVGIPDSERAAMRDANVGGTGRVLDAVLELRPAAPLTGFEDLGHYPQIEDPSRVSAALQAALAA